MNRRLTLFVVALLSLFAGYILAYKLGATVISANASTAYQVANQHVIYVAPEGVSRGKVNEGIMRNRGVTLAHDWESAKAETHFKQLDALIIDRLVLDQANQNDYAWINDQFHAGVVIVALGVEDERLATILGLRTLQSPGEGNSQIQSTGYRLISATVIGQPQDAEVVKRSNWIERAINGEAESVTGVNSPLITSFSKLRGALDTEQDVNQLFQNLDSVINGLHDSQIEYEQAVKSFRGE